jgi:hypothetical protein
LWLSATAHRCDKVAERALLPVIAQASAVINKRLLLD